MVLFSRLFRRKPAAAPWPAFSAQTAPERLLYVVGDIHGRADLLERLLKRLSGETAPYDLVFVGDYIDRGEESAAVLGRLCQLSDDSHVTCLMGNHERMLLDFLDDPAQSGRRWGRNGGLQTLASFAIGNVNETSDGTAMTAARDSLRHKLGPIEAWLRALPLSFQSGNIFIPHAAADPRLPISAQVDKTLIWGHPAFFQEPRQDGIWVIHGHTIMDQAEAIDGRIGIDTGAYATGRLTAVRIEGSTIEFLST